MDKWFGIDAEEQPMLGLSHSEKNHKLLERQKQTLDSFLERGAISRQQYEKSLYDLSVKMGESEERKDD
ncbi:MAG: hypothetical protein Q4C27_02475 [Eubacteriales bacterium]|nr:hypothetical protein [Eubacteriales bacterium]